MSIDIKFEKDSDNDEMIVIRIPVFTLPQCVVHACDEEYGFENHDIKVNDLEVFKKEFVNSLLEESENGDTLLHKAFDTAIINAIENGCLGIINGEEY